MLWAQRCSTSDSQASSGSSPSEGPTIANVVLRDSSASACSSGIWLSVVTSTTSGHSEARAAIRSGSS